MASLRDILYKVQLKTVHGSTDREISTICSDSRKVEAGACFVALRGTAVNGHEHIAAAISKGAAVIVCEKLL